MTTREMTMTKRMFATLALALAVAAGAGTALAASTPERIVFDGNVLWKNSQDGINPLPYAATSGPCTTSVAITYSVTQLATSFFTHNRTDIDPKLVDPFNLDNPRFDPQQLSPLNAKYAGDAVVMDVKALDPWFEAVDFVGAVPYRFADPTQDWTTGWTYYNRVGGLGRTDISYAKPVVILTGLQTSSMTLTPANNYLLRGKVEMAGGTTLTIQAGTYLFGEKATTGYLTIDRGAKIFVNGTKAAPVVLTSDQTPGSMAPGDNGGVVLHGRAIANCLNAALNDSCVSEGGAGYFGGNDDNDASGTIRYMRIEYSGKELSPDNELNSLTQNAVGRGTVIEYVEAFEGSDDGFEWFGGVGRVSHIISSGQDDDGLDWQLGFRGRVQFEIVQQEPGRGDKGIEADNSEFNYAAFFRSNPIIANCTFIGTNSPTPGAGSSNIGVHLRRGTAGTLVNCVILGFRGPGLTLSDPETFANCPGPAPAIHINPAVTAVEASESPIGLHDIYAKISPNPVRTQAKILFGLSRDGTDVRAQIFDARGRLVETLVQGSMGKGVHTLSWTPSRSLPTGQYFFRVRTNDGLSSSGKIALVR